MSEGQLRGCTPFPGGRTTVLLVILLLSAKPALAYIDPGSGALLLQGLVAAGVGALYFFRGLVRDLLRRLGFGRSQESNEEPPASEH